MKRKLAIFSVIFLMLISLLPVTPVLAEDFNFSEDFESYTLETYPGTFTQLSNGTGDADQKVIDNGGDKVFQLSGIGTSTSLHKVDIPDGVSGIFVLEADVIDKMSAPLPFFMTIKSDNGNYISISSEDLKLASKTSNSGTSFVKYSADFYGNTKYNIKIMYDITAKTCDFYVDGVKVNSTSLDVSDMDALSHFELAAHSSFDEDTSVILFDNVKAYSTTTSEVIKIEGESVYRTSATEATIRLYASADGNVKYLVTDFAAIPASFDTAQSTAVFEGVNDFDILGLSSGEKYLHLMLETTSDTSEISTIHIPTDVYFTEDFEAYAADEYPDTFYIKYNGTGDANQKILDDNDNYVFRTEGAGSWASEHRVDLPSGLTGTVVLSGKVKAISGSWPVIFELGSNSGTWGTRLVRVNLKNGYFSVDSGGTLTDFTDVTYNNGQWYDIETTLDLDNDLFVVKVDGVMLGTEPLSLNTTATLDFIEIGAGNIGTSEGYFDDVELYTSSESVSLNYTLSYDANGAESGTTPEDSVHEENTTVTVSGNTGSLTKTGYSFVGWNTESNGSGISYVADDTFSITSDVTLYAEWAPVEVFGASIHRTAEEYATVRLNASVAGTFYYWFTGSPNYPGDDSLLRGRTKTAVAGYNNLIIDNPNDLDRGIQYLHLALVADGVMSDPIMIEVTSDYYFIEDFEVYEVGDYPSEFVRLYNGSGETDQKVIDNSEDYEFQISAGESVGANHKVDVSAGITNTVVLETELEATGAGTMPFEVSFVDTNSNRISISASEGKFTSKSIDDNYLDVPSTIDFVYNTKYNIKIELDLKNKIFNYYVDGIMANSSPLPASMFGDLSNFELSAGATGAGGASTMLFDDVEVYTVISPIRSADNLIVDDAYWEANNVANVVTIDLSTLPAQSILTITTSYQVVVTGVAPAGGIEIVLDAYNVYDQNPMGARLTLMNVTNIANSFDDMCALMTLGTANYLTVTGVNLLESGKDRAGINVPYGTGLNINSGYSGVEGYLEVSSINGAGIGGNDGEDSGQLGFGTEVQVEAYSYDGAGIGGGRYGRGTYTYIHEDSEVYAYSTNKGAGIGGGLDGESGPVYVNDNALVYAESYAGNNDIGSSLSVDNFWSLTVNTTRALFLAHNTVNAGLSSVIKDKTHRLFDNEVIVNNQAYGYDVPQHWSGIAYAYMPYIGLNGTSVYRSSAADAEVAFYSNSAGEILYAISESADAPLTYDEGTVVSILEGTNKISVSGLTDGAKYIHLALRVNDQIEDELTIQVPSNVYYFDDFEVYTDRTYPYFFNEIYSGSGSSNQVATYYGNDMIFKLQGRDQLSEHRIDLPSGLSGEFVVSTEVTPFSGGWPVTIGLGYSDGTQDTKVVRIKLNDRYFTAESGNDSYDLRDVNLDYSEVHELKLIYDIDDGIFAVYANGVMAGSTPIAISTDSVINYVEFGIGDEAYTYSYFDDIEFYLSDANEIRLSKDLIIDDVYWNANQFDGVLVHDISTHYAEDTLTITTSNPVKLTGNAPEGGIEIIFDAYDMDDIIPMGVDVTLDNVTNIASSRDDMAAITSLGQNNQLRLSGTNIIESAEDKAGINVPSVGQLIIKGVYNQNGTLDVSSGNGAGIGGNDGEYGGSIHISNSANINAHSVNGAGIGGGRNGGSTFVSITGYSTDSGYPPTIVYAYSENAGAGIGGGENGRHGTLNVWDAYVYAESQGGGSDIGAGLNGSGDGRIDIRCDAAVFLGNNNMVSELTQNAHALFSDETIINHMAYGYDVPETWSGTAYAYLKYIELTDLSIHRTSETEATVSLNSNSAGEISYYVTDSEELTLSFRNGTKVVATEGLNEFNLSGLTSSVQYLHIVLYVGDTYSDPIAVQIPAYAYSIEYFANEADGGTAPEAADYVHLEQAVIEDNTGLLEKSGYTFEGWNTETDGSGTHYDVGDTFSVEENLTLYAEWSKVVIVTSTPTPTPIATTDEVIWTLSLSKRSLTMLTDDTAELTYWIWPRVISDVSVTWTSLNPNVASVENGVVTAHEVGTTVITISVIDGLGNLKTASATVKVTSSIWETYFSRWGFFRGILRDSSGNILPWYRLWLFSDPMETTTDADGYFSFENVEFGNHTLLVYDPDGVEVGRMSINMNESTSADVALTNAAHAADIDISEQTEGLEFALVLNDDNSVEITEVLVVANGENEETVEPEETTETEVTEVVEVSETESDNNWLFYIFGLVVLAVVIVFVMKSRSKE